MDGWPENSSFYLVSIIIGLGSGIGAITTFHLAAKFNGRISILHSAVAMLFTFIVWAIIDENTRSLFTETPIKGFVISLLIISAGVSLFFMSNKGSESKKSNYIIPTLLIGSLSVGLTIIGKFALPSETSSDLGIKVLIMGLLIFLTQIAFSFFIILFQRFKGKACNFNFKKHAKGKVVYLGILSSAGCITSWAAIALAPNPAYVKAILMSAPILLLAYHKLRNIEDNANPIAGTILAISVILLILIQ